MCEKNLYVSFCNGSDIKDKEVLLSIPPDIAFKLERLAEKNGTDVNSYIIYLLREETEKLFPGNKGYYKKFFR